jgi:polyisoprenoid-binding protein YceI
MRTGLKWVIGAVAALVIVVVGGAFIYAAIDKPQAKPTLSADASSSDDESTATTSAAALSGDIGGTWKPTSASKFQYRVEETLFGARNTATGETNDVTGSMTVSGTSISAAELTVDMTSVSSDRTQRDGQFRGRIMQTATYPTATFKLTQPIDLGSVPAPGTVVTTSATGQLTLHGVTKTVTFTVKAQRTRSGTIEANGEIPIVFADYDISDPSGGPARTEDHGTLVFLAVFAKA